jgi:hypothetical protein
MPETRLEKVLFTLGLVAIAALAVVVGRYWYDQRGSAAGQTKTSRTAAVTGTSRRAGATVTRSVSPTTVPATPGGTTIETTTTGTTTTGTTTTGTTTTGTTTEAAVVTLSLTAVRGDSWMEVRSESATGTVLYVGTLTAGTTKTFQALALWARFGVAGNVDARLDGQPLQLRAGTYSGLFSRSGFRSVRG